MAKRLGSLPKWAKLSLQGITYWIGHRRALYSGYPLGESAVVAEMCNMIYTHLAADQTLRCEVQYSELMKGTGSDSILTERARVDIVVFTKNGGSRHNVTPTHVIEIKRASASNAQINKDLQRLAAVKKGSSEIKAFLVVVAEAQRPVRFVDAQGTAITKPYRIPDTNQLYRVRRVCKAAHAFSSKDRAQYACLLEVSPTQTAERLADSSIWSA